jgi:hypothetical protein
VQRAPEWLHVLDVLVAGAGVEQDHAVVRRELAARLELAGGGDAGTALRSHEQALGGGRFLDAGDDLGLGHRDRRAVALSDCAQDQEVAERFRHAQAVGVGGGAFPEGRVGLAFEEGLDDRSAALRLDRVHAGPLPTHEAHRLHLGEGLPHADEAGAAARRVEDRVGQRPAELLGDLVAHRLLAFDAVGLLERRALVPAVLLCLCRADAPGVRDQSVDHLHVRAVGLRFHDEQLRDVAR